MATLAKLVEQNVVFKVEPYLDPGTLPSRYMYGLENPFRKFLDSVPTLGSTWKIDQSPYEQLDDLLTEFVGAEPLMVTWRFGPLLPVRGKPWPGVWELKTPDLRIFGWFPFKNTFIAVNGCQTQKVKEINGLYGGFRDEVVWYRKQLDLDEPKFLSGEDHSDVVSLVCRPDQSKG